MEFENIWKNGDREFRQKLSITHLEVLGLTQGGMMMGFNIFNQFKAGTQLITPYNSPPPPQPEPQPKPEEEKPATPAFDWTDPFGIRKAVFGS